MKEHSPHDASLIVLTLPQFHGLLDGLLDEKLKPLLAAFSAGLLGGQAEYLTTQQALNFVHLSKPTLNKLRQQGVITACRSSDKRVLYKRSELVAYLEASKRKEVKTSC